MAIRYTEGVRGRRADGRQADYPERETPNMDDAVDAADQIQEAAEERAAGARFRREAAVAIGVLAMCLAIAGLGGDNATKEMVNANIQASDTWAFYQAKNVRQTQYRLALDALQLRLQTETTLTPDQRSALERQAASYQDTINRY